MKKEILSAIENVEIYPIISLLIFVLFFIGMAWWVFRVDKGYIRHMESLPVEGENQKNEKDEKR